MKNIAEQADEVEVLISIYGKDFKVEDEAERSYSISIGKKMTLHYTYNDDYPSDCAPNYTLVAPYLNAEKKKRVNKDFVNIYSKNQGAPVIYQWIERLKEIVRDGHSKAPLAKIEANGSKKTKSLKLSASLPIKTYDIYHGPSIQEKKSVFQAHVCAIDCEEDVQNIRSVLLQNKKIAQAKHNVIAYRLKQSKGIVLEECDDDGENLAGGRLLHLLQLVKVMNVVVIATRWFGGIEIGPNRFKHYNNSSRLALQEAQFIK